MIKSLEFFFLFFKATTSAIYCFSRISFNLPRTFAVCCEALFLPFLTSLLITYLMITSRLAKEIIVVENVLNCESKNLYE